MLLSPRVAIVSDPLVQRGGAERVVETFAEAFPEAPIYAILYSAETGPASLAKRIRPSWLQKIPGAAKRHRVFLPFFPFSIEGFDLSDFDIILSSHHTAAKGLLRNADQLHICYCHTPMRALWERSAAELRTLSSITRPVASVLLSGLRIWDFAAAAGVDIFVANSRVTQRRILSHYGRESQLLPPPIDVDRFTPSDSLITSKPYYLVASRPVPYKRVDIAVDAALKMDRRVVIAGGNHHDLPPHPNISMVGSVGDRELVDLMRGATALLFPQREDFGMTPLEMNACGRPTIAYAAGGALETVIDGKTGVLVAEQTPEAFANGIARLEQSIFDPVALRQHAMLYSKEVFVRQIQAIVRDAWAQRSEQV